MHRIFMRSQKLCCILLALLLVSVSFFADAQEIKVGKSRDQLVRVCLTRLGGRERLDLTFTAPYQLMMENGAILYFHSGSHVTFQVENDLIYLYYQEMGQQLGAKVSLARSSESANEMTGFRLTNFPALYMGDLQLDIIDGKLRAILTIHVEDYLLGVVPYEMGESFPMEALKAQAIAARTYALRRQGQYQDFDIVDNTNDQVFRGYIIGYGCSEKAVQETRGICGYHKGELAQCYYSASNGGQTELVQTVWDSRRPYEYYVSGEDPYDVANPESIVRRFKLMKQYSTGKQAPYALRKIVAEHFVDTLQDQGYKASPDHVRIDAITSVGVDSPSSPASKHMTNLHLELKISIRKKPEFTIRVIDSSPEEVNLFADTVPEVTEDPVSAQAMADEEAPSPEIDYMPFASWDETVSIDIPIFPEAEEAFSLNISGNYQNEIWSVVEDADAFTIEVRRYGHGVGMSQRGAQWMASEHGMTYQEILAFYYPGMELIQFPEQARMFVDTDAALAATAGPAPTPTPRPTLMPATQSAEKGQWYAAVTEIADDSSLNLRSEPSMNGDILMRLYKGQRLLVLERCEEEGWVRVRTDVAEGYVMESYLTAEKQ